MKGKRLGQVPAGYSKIPASRPDIKSLREAKRLERWLRRKGLLGHWKNQQLAKQLDFGAPRKMRKGEKPVDSNWFIPGGGIETQRPKH